MISVDSIKNYGKWHRDWNTDLFLDVIYIVALKSSTSQGIQ